MLSPGSLLQRHEIIQHDVDGERQGQDLLKALVHRYAHLLSMSASNGLIGRGQSESRPRTRPSRRCQRRLDCEWVSTKARRRWVDDQGRFTLALAHPFTETAEHIGSDECQASRSKASLLIDQFWFECHFVESLFLHIFNPCLAPHFALIL